MPGARCPGSLVLFLSVLPILVAIAGCLFGGIGIHTFMASGCLDLVVAACCYALCLVLAGLAQRSGDGMPVAVCQLLACFALGLFWYFFDDFFQARFSMDELLLLWALCLAPQFLLRPTVPIWLVLVLLVFFGILTDPLLDGSERLHTPWLAPLGAALLLRFAGSVLADTGSVRQVPAHLVHVCFSRQTACRDATRSDLESHEDWGLFRFLWTGLPMLLVEVCVVQIAVAALSGIFGLDTFLEPELLKHLPGPFLAGSLLAAIMGLVLVVLLLRCTRDRQEFVLHLCCCSLCLLSALSLGRLFWELLPILVLLLFCLTAALPYRSLLPRLTKGLALLYAAFFLANGMGRVFHLSSTEDALVWRVIALVLMATAVLLWRRRGERALPGLSALVLALAALFLAYNIPWVEITLRSGEVFGVPRDMVLGLQIFAWGSSLVLFLCLDCVPMRLFITFHSLLETRGRLNGLLEWSEVGTLTGIRLVLLVLVVIFFLRKGWLTPLKILSDVLCGIGRALRTAFCPTRMRPTTGTASTPPPNVPDGQRHAVIRCFRLELRPLAWHVLVVLVMSLCLSGLVLKNYALVADGRTIPVSIDNPNPDIQFPPVLDPYIRLRYSDDFVSPGMAGPGCLPLRKDAAGYWRPSHRDFVPQSDCTGIPAPALRVQSNHFGRLQTTLPGFFNLPRRVDNELAYIHFVYSALFCFDEDNNFFLYDLGDSSQYGFSPRGKD